MDTLHCLVFPTAVITIELFCLFWNYHHVRLPCPLLSGRYPDYLKRKLAKVRAAGRDDLILLVYEGVNLTDDKLQDVPGEVLYFATKPIIKHVMAAVEPRAQ